MAEQISNELDPKQAFAKAIGDAIRQFLDEHGMSQAEIAERWGVESRQKFSSYLLDQGTGHRVPIPAYLFYLACTQLHGFHFDHKGYRISAKPIKGKGEKAASLQSTFEFGKDFELMDKAGTLTVKVKRPPEKIELSVSVDARVTSASQTA